MKDYVIIVRPGPSLGLLVNLAMSVLHDIGWLVYQLQAVQNSILSHMEIE